MQLFSCFREVLNFSYASQEQWWLVTYCHQHYPIKPTYHSIVQANNTQNLKSTLYRHNNQLHRYLNLSQGGTTHLLTYVIKHYSWLSIFKQSNAAFIDLGIIILDRDRFSHYLYGIFQHIIQKLLRLSRTSTVYISTYHQNERPEKERGQWYTM